MDRLIGVVRERMAQVMAMRFNKWLQPEEYDELARAALAALQREQWVPVSESLPLMARDTCTNCGGTGVGGYHVHAPQEDAVEALRCEACDGFGSIEHGPKDCPATTPELPLMARREWMCRDTDYFVVHGDFCLEVESFRGKAPRYAADGSLIVIGDSAVCDQVDAEAQPDGIYRIADTDEHGLPVIERTADMPKRAKYRIALGCGMVIYQSELEGVGFVDTISRRERIEDYRSAAQEGCHG